MASASSRNNILAGGFLLGAVGLAVASSFIIKGIQLTPRTGYAVYFPMSVGASGLQPGSSVNLGGRQVGEVAGLTFYTTAEAEAIGLEGLIEESTEVPESTGVALEDGSPDRLAGVRVLVEINEDVPLFDNAQVFLEKQLLGSGSEINIASVGNPAAPGFVARGPSPRLEAGEAIVGRVAAPAFLRDAGLGPTEQKLISETVKKVHRIVSNVDDIVAENRGKVAPVIDNFREGSESFRDGAAQLASLGENADGWSERVDTILGNTVAFTERFDPFVDNADAGIADARNVIAAIRAAIDENRPNLDRTLSSLADASERVRDEVVPNANETMVAARKFSERLDALIAESAPAMRRVLANARLAADQLKLATIEVRSQPWRLLYQPTTKEVEEQLLYDSARTYASAVSDLRATSESLESVLAAAQADPGAMRPDDLRRLREELEAAFQRYERTEQDLLDRLVERR